MSFSLSRSLSIGSFMVLAACSSPGPTPSAPASAESAKPPQTYSVEEFYKNTQCRGAAWSADGRKILVSSDLSGIWNAYAVPASGGSPEPLTQSKTDSVFALSYFPSDDRILYSSDQAGNELTHIYVQNPDGSRVDVTPGVKLKANFHGWAGDDRSFFVSTNERDPRYFDLYEIAADGYKRTLLYRNTEGFTLGPVSRDKRYIALSKPRTTSDADIFLHDRTANETRNIMAHSGTVSNNPEDFSPDGRRLLFTSDADREFTSLRAYDIGAGTTNTIVEDKWDILGAEYSKCAKFLVVYVNEDSRYTARVLEAETLKPILLSAPATATIRGVTISRDDGAIAFYATDGSVPADLYAGKIGADPRRLTDALNPSIRREDLVVPTVVRFKSYDGLEIPGLLYRPHQAQTTAKLPALVLVHGGPGAQAQVGYVALTQALVNYGYVVYDINNRGSSGYGKTFFALDDRKHGEADLGDVVATARCSQRRATSIPRESAASAAVMVATWCSRR